MPLSKSFAALNAEDLAATLVWRHKPAERLNPGEDESWLEAVDHLPVVDAFDHYFTSRVRLADGSEEWAMIGKTQPHHPSINEKSQLFVFFRGAHKHEWTNNPPWAFPERADPSALARFLDKVVEQVFPFTYDISALLIGDEQVLRRRVDPRTYTMAPSGLEVALAAASEHLESARSLPRSES